MIRPIDLQTLFMNLDKVGKDQAHSKEAQAAAQAAQVQKLHKEHDKGDHSVGQTSASTGDEGDPAVKIKADGQGPGQERPRSGKQQPPEEGEKEKKDSTWKDPELGTHVDISG